MGWPIGWSSANVNQSSDSQESAKSNTDAWRNLLQMRLCSFFDAASPGLQQTAGSGDFVQTMPRQRAWGSADAEAGCLRDLQNDFSANSGEKSAALRQPPMPAEDGRDCGGEKMGESPADKELPELQSGIQTEAFDDKDLLTVMRQQTRVEQAMTNRAQRLRCCGNGVVTLQASLAAVLLIGRATA